jgi:hypothetical protein
MADAATDLMFLSEYVYERTTRRLEGLGDGEYLWEPVADCWTIRTTGSGRYRADHEDAGRARAFTTIGWRLWHLIGCYGAARNAQWLGVTRSPGHFDEDDPAPSTATEAVGALGRAHHLWQGVLEAIPADAWGQQLGAIAGPYAENDKTSFVLHQLDEQIHHGAELGVLRDLYASVFDSATAGS